MDAQAVISAIGSVGFPIVAAVGMFYLYDKTVKDLTSMIQKIDITLQMLVNRMDGGAKDVD